MPIGGRRFWRPFARGLSEGAEKAGPAFALEAFQEQLRRATKAREERRGAEAEFLSPGEAKTVSEFMTRITGVPMTQQEAFVMPMSRLSALMKMAPKAAAQPFEAPPIVSEFLGKELGRPPEEVSAAIGKLTKEQRPLVTSVIGAIGARERQKVGVVERGAKEKGQAIQESISEAHRKAQEFAARGLYSKGAAVKAAEMEFARRLPDELRTRIPGITEPELKSLVEKQTGRTFQAVEQLRILPETGKKLRASGWTKQQASDWLKASGHPIDEIEIHLSNMGF